MTAIDEVQLKERLGSGTAIVAKFTADWCGPCHAIAPELEKLAATHTDIEFVSVDVDANPALAHELGVMSIPTLVHFGGDGREVARSTGAMPAPALQVRLRLDA